jgi:integration host factor subunit alpha
MSDKTLTRMDLADAVHQEVGLSRNDSATLVESVLRHVSDALVRGGDGQDILLRDLLGAGQGGAGGAQPQDGPGSADTSRRVLTFRSSHLMKDRIAQGNRG